MQGNPWKMVLATGLVVMTMVGQVAWGAEGDGSDAVSRGRLVQRLKDPVAGGEVRVYSAGTAGLTLEVADSHVRVVKTMGAKGSETTIVAGQEQVRLVQDGTGLVVTTGDGVTWRPGRNRQAAERTRDRLLKSPAMKRAFTLLDTMTLPATTPLAPMVWGVKVVVHAAMGDGRALTRPPRVASSSSAKARLLPVGLQDHGPGWCWDEYAKEAIKAQLEVEDCLANLKWYDFFGDDRCWIIFEMRAFGAFVWWIKCVGLDI